MPNFYLAYKHMKVARHAGARFPKFVLHRCTHFHELRKVTGTSKLIDSSAAFLFEVPGSNSPLVAQELQIGGTGRPCSRRGRPALDPASDLRQARRDPAQGPPKSAMKFDDRE
jgi:hypothetical protein